MKSPRFIAILLLGAIATLRAGEVTTELHARRTTAPPVIDGKLDEPCWKNTPVVTNFHTSAKADEPAWPQTTIQLLYDDKNIYFGIEVMNPSMPAIIKEGKQAKGRPEKEAWAIDAVEWYLSADDPAQYYFFVMNVLGTRGDVHFGGIEDDPFAWNGTWNGEVGWLSDRWVIEAAIPYRDVSEKPAKPGDVWLTNFARTMAGNPNHLSALNPKYGGFHYLGVKLHFDLPEPATK